MQMGWWWYLCFFVRRFGSLYTRRCQRGAVKGVIPALSSQYTSDQCIFGKMLRMNQEWRLRAFFLSSSSSAPSSSLARQSPLHAPSSVCRTHAKDSDWFRYASRSDIWSEFFTEKRRDNYDQKIITVPCEFYTFVINNRSAIKRLGTPNYINLKNISFWRDNVKILIYVTLKRRKWNSLKALQYCLYNCPWTS